MALTPRFYLAGASALAVLALASCGSGIGNAGPRVEAVPAQSADGGATFTLDLADFTSDREGTALTYRVVSGGGSFAGSVYSHTFPTLGVYTVVFEVHDNDKVTTSEFEVTVATANLAVVSEGDSGLLLLDTATEQFLRLADGVNAPRLATTLSDGKVLYYVGPQVSQELWVFNPMARRTDPLGSGHAGAATYVTRTSDNLVLFTCGEPSDLDLYSYDATTGVVRAVSANAGETDGNPMVNKDDLVFFERGVAGQTDIFVYDPSANSSVAVSTDPAGETLEAVLADGGVVFSRLHNGFNQLFYYRQDLGLTALPTLATAVDAGKDYVGATSSSDVIYRFTDAGTPADALGWWNVDGTTGRFAASTATGTMTLAGVTANRELVLVEEVSATDHDLFVVNTAAATLFTVGTADVVSVKAVTTDGTNTYVVYQDEVLTNLHLRNVTTGVTTTFSDAAGLSFLGTLANGDVIYQKGDQTSITAYDVSAATSFTAPGVGMTFAGAGAAEGDVVFTAEVAGQTDLFLWDASAATAVVISANGADDRFEAVTAQGRVLFTREDGTGKRQLHLFDPTDTTTEQLTEADAQGVGFDFAVLGVFAVQ